MVFLFIPNIIGYVRYLFLFAALFTYRTHPILTLVFYGLSQLFDMFDGMAARKFKQSTNFGAVLDMVCDRASDAVILAILASLYPEYSWIFLADIILDLTSHWFQMYSAISSGEHHKKSKTNWKLLELYYSNKAVLFTLVAGNEIFFLTCYLNAFKETLGLPPELISLNYVLLGINFVLFLIKKMMSVIQLISASEKIA